MHIDKLVHKTPWNRETMFMQELSMMVRGQGESAQDRSVHGSELHACVVCLHIAIYFQDYAPQAFLRPWSCMVSYN